MWSASQGLVQASVITTLHDGVDYIMQNNKLIKKNSI